jgi:hypothetical protein
MIGLSAFDSAGRRRSPATMPGARRGTRDALPGRPTDGGGDRRGDAPGRRRPSGWRLRAMIIVLGRAGLRVQEALALAEHDLDPRRAVGSGSERQGRAATRGRHGRAGLGAAAPLAQRPGRTSPRAAVLHDRRPHPRARVVGRRGPLRVPTARRSGGAQASVRAASAAPRARAGARPRGRPAQHHPAPARAHQLGTTSIYLQGIDAEEIIATVRTRRAPMMSASAGLQL